MVLTCAQTSLPWDDDIDVGVLWPHVQVLQWISKGYRSPDYDLAVNPHFRSQERLKGSAPPPVLLSYIFLMLHSKLLC